jgi:DNA processing protein
MIGRLADPIERARERAQRLPGVLAMPDEDLLGALGTHAAGSVAREYAGFDPDQAERHCRASGVEALCRCDESYPARLRQLEDPPAVLFVAGEVERFLALVGEQPVAVVGARRASGYGLEVAAGLGRGLAAAGVTVVSGMALGVDSAAHAGALDARGGTVAVLAAGPERAYPASKRHLYARIRAEGAVVSELPPGTTARKWSFPARNRVIAGLAVLTVVVEAGEGSGSLITASLAQQAGRDVAAVPGRVTSPLSAGTNALIVDGARPVRDARDVVEGLFGVEAGPASGRGARDELSSELRSALDAVGEGDDSVPRLCARGFGADSALAAFAELELLGYVRRGAGGRYAIVT